MNLHRTHTAQPLGYSSILSTRRHKSGKSWQLAAAPVLETGFNGCFMAPIPRGSTAVPGRPATSEPEPPLAGASLLDFSLLGHLERVIHFDPEVPDGALELRVPEEQLTQRRRSYRKPTVTIGDASRSPTLPGRPRLTAYGFTIQVFSGSL